MRTSVCHGCPDRQAPKTCEATCARRQQEITALAQERYNRQLDGMEMTSNRIAAYRHQKHKQIKQGRKG